MLLLQGTSMKTAVLFAQVNISWKRYIITIDLNVRGSTSTIIILSRLESIRMNFRWKVSSPHTRSLENPLEWQFPSEFRVYVEMVVALCEDDALELWQYQPAPSCSGSRHCAQHKSRRDFSRRNQAATMMKPECQCHLSLGTPFSFNFILRHVFHSILPKKQTSKHLRYTCSHK